VARGVALARFWFLASGKQPATSNHYNLRVEIRAAAPRDIDQVLAMERASFVDPWSRNGFMAELIKAGTRFWVMDEG